MSLRYTRHIELQEYYIANTHQLAPISLLRGVITRGITIPPRQEPVDASANANPSCLVNQLGTALMVIYNGRFDISLVQFELDKCRSRLYLLA